MTTSLEKYDFNAYSLQVINSLSIRKKTLSTYSSILRRHVSPAMEGKLMNEITRSDIQELISKLPPQTAATTLAVIKSIFREAIARNQLVSSPVHGIAGPSICVSPRKFLTWSDIERLDFGRHQDSVRFLALHGLRWGEAVCLTSNDVRDGRIHITKSIHGQTKTRSGMRTVPLVGEFVQIPSSPKTLRRVLSPHGVTIHSLRHTFAYILKRQGVHVTTAQRLLGHSDPRVTLSIYTQVLDDEIDEVGRMMNLMIN